MIEPDTDDVLAHWASLRQDRGWPQDGARLDQSAAYLAAVSILDMELGLIREEQQETAARKFKKDSAT